MSVRVAVKFENLMVNSDNVVFEGVCNTYEKDKSKEKEYLWRKGTRRTILKPLFKEL